MSEELRMTLGDDWSWPVKEFRDDRLMIHCRSPTEARELERPKEIHLTQLSFSCEPWTQDIWKIDRADGEIRWLEIRNMPTFYWNGDSAGKILKTIRDFIYVYMLGGMYIYDIRALVRIRRGRTMPCIIWTNIGSRKYRIVVGMERGQDPLPWSNDGGYGKLTLDLEEEDRCPKPANQEKRKAPMPDTGWKEGKDGNNPNNQTERMTRGVDWKDERPTETVRTERRLLFPSDFPFIDSVPAKPSPVNKGGTLASGCLCVCAPDLAESS
ncbi:hypothetical protein J5N97_030151 [Dioscorea zingiberensis]|uniref:Uncharacterized protein n=1 Tax=Dioscorea zingiberensis TaxID=325984 RepID=A0A9D5BX33_9LILI|nr:hypothetical protein J5N97_030151 [Dioscorea zingiberensis]